MDKPISNTAVSKRQKQKVIQVISAITLLIVIVVSIRALLTPAAAKDSLRLAKVERGTIASTINASGIVVPAREETLVSETDSKILKVLVKTGQFITKGTPLIQLDTRAIDLSIEKIEEQIALKDTQIIARQLAANKSINEINSRYQLLEVELERHSVKVKRITQLTESGAIAAHDLLEAELNVKRARIELAQLKQAVIDIQSTAQAEIAGLKLERSIMSKSLTEQQRLRTNSRLLSSRDGILTWLKDDEGASVSLGEPLAKISDQQNFRIKATLSDYYAPMLETGMSAVIIYNKTKLTGKLATLSPTIENGVMSLLIQLDTPKTPLLQNNLRVDVGLITETASDTNILQKGPFINGKGIQDIFVVKDGVAIRTQVEVGMSNKDKYQIIRGVKPGDEVIISDVSRFMHLDQFLLN